MRYTAWYVSSPFMSVLREAAYMWPYFLLDELSVLSPAYQLVFEVVVFLLVGIESEFSVELQCSFLNVASDPLHDLIVGKHKASLSPF